MKKQSPMYAYGIIIIAVTRWVVAIVFLAWLGSRWHPRYGTVTGAVVGMVFGAIWGYLLLKKLEAEPRDGTDQ